METAESHHVAGRGTRLPSAVGNDATYTWHTCRRSKSRGQRIEYRYPNVHHHESSDCCCKFRGQRHLPSKHACKAFGDTYTTCKKKNHFAQACKSKQWRDNCEFLTDESLLSLCNDNDRRCFANTVVEGQHVRFLMHMWLTANVPLLQTLTYIGQTDTRLATAVFDTEHI